MINAAVDLDREIKVAAAHTGSSSHEVLMSRILLDVGATGAVEIALSVAARLLGEGMMASQIRRNYAKGGITHDLVTKLVKEAEQAHNPGDYAAVEAHIAD